MTGRRLGQEQRFAHASDIAKQLMRDLGFGSHRAQRTGDKLERFFYFGKIIFRSEEFLRVDERSEHARNIAVAVAKRRRCSVNYRSRWLVGNEAARQFQGDETRRG